MDTDNSFDVHDFHEVLKKKDCSNGFCLKMCCTLQMVTLIFWLDNDDIPGRSWQLRPPKMTTDLDKQDQ